MLKMNFCHALFEEILPHKLKKLLCKNEHRFQTIIKIEQSFEKDLINLHCVHFLHFFAPITMVNCYGGQ